MSEKTERKEPIKLSRRQFLRGAGAIIGGTAVSSAFILTACGQEMQVIKTVTTTAPGATGTVTATTTAPGNTVTSTTGTTAVQEIVKYVCPICGAEYDSLDLLKDHVDTYHQVTSIALPKSAYIQWDPNECAACSRCLMACAAVHSGSVALQLSGVKWVDKQEFYGFEPRMPLFCQQCTYPECYYACPTHAIEIDSTTGARYVNEAKCNGCGICEQACPFDVPRVQVDVTEPIATRKAFKCDLCKDRENGPACIEVCNRQALKLVSAEGRL